MQKIAEKLQNDPCSITDQFSTTYIATAQHFNHRDTLLHVCFPCTSFQEKIENRLTQKVRAVPSSYHAMLSNAEDVNLYVKFLN